MAAYFIAEERNELPDFSSMTPYRQGVVDVIDFDSTDDTFADSGRNEHVAATFTGFLTITQPGSYSFSLESDDGSKLFLDDQLVIDNNGLHDMIEKSTGFEWNDVTIPLTDPGGTHELFIVYRSRPSGESDFAVKLNWIEFHGPGVTVEPNDDQRFLKRDHRDDTQDH